MIIIVCLIIALLLFAQTFFEVGIYPVIILVFFTIISSLYSYKKSPKKYTHKCADRKEQLYGILNKIKKYNKIIYNNDVIDLIMVTDIGLIALKIIDYSGRIELTDKNNLVLIKANNVIEDIPDFISEYNKEIKKIQELTGIEDEKIKKYIIRRNDLIIDKTVDNSFIIQTFSTIYYELNKYKKIYFTKDEIDNIYELVNNGSNEN